MNLESFPRRHYSNGATPIEKMPRLTRELGGPSLYIKRDDTLGFAGGGNKIRKLEFIMADALAQDADTLITCGAVQSNHCRLTLAAAVREGLRCRLVLEERVPDSYDPEAGGNNLLFHLLDAERIRAVAGGSDMMAEMEKEARDLRSAGRRPYIIPGGGATALGALGYVSCAHEIMAQVKEGHPRFDHIVCASGSGGTHAGLLAGFSSSGWSVTGINVSRSREEQEEKIYRLACDTASLMDAGDDIRRESVRCRDEYVGQGYSIPTEEMKEAVRLLARTEAILLDPVYTGKAMAGLIDMIHKGDLKKGETVLFLHTGGSPGLYAHPEYFLAAD